MPKRIIPALLFAGVPLIFIAGVAVFQLAKNVPDARIARANTVLSFETIRAANAVDEAIQVPSADSVVSLLRGSRLILNHMRGRYSASLSL